jgi:magnesium-transporting ATPase (P-type)
MHDRSYVAEKIIIVLCDLLIIISIILTFFLLYELSLISQAMNRGIVYNFILFSVLVLSVIFKGYHEMSSQVARFFFLTIAFVFSIFLMIYIRNVTREQIPFGIAITLVAITGALSVLSFVCIIMCWKHYKKMEIYKCKNVLGQYYSDVIESSKTGEEEFIPLTRKEHKSIHKIY